MNNHTTSTLPERFRDPDALARFIVENEWALDSDDAESGIVDWREALNRVYEAWDGDTPDDIVAAIAAAVRLDRSFRVPLSLDALRTAWENAEVTTAETPVREGDLMIYRHEGGFAVEPADRILNGQTHGPERVLSRAPQREPWKDLAGVLGDFAIADEHSGQRDDAGLARALHKRGVRVTGGGEA